MAKNEEVMISLKANVQPFRDAMKDAMNDITLGVRDMEEFNAMIDNANKKELRGITKNLNEEIKETSLIIQDMQKELVIATQTNASPKSIERLKNDINVANNELATMKKRLEQANNAGGMPIIQKGIAKMKAGFENVKSHVNIVTNSLKRMAVSSALFAGLGAIRSALSNAIEQSDTATSSFGAMANAISGALIPVVNALSNALSKAFAWLAGLIKFVTGFDILGKGISNVNNQIKKTGTNAKKAKKSLDGTTASFDEINNIDTSSGDSGGSSSGGGGVDLSGQLNALQDMKALSESFDFSWAEPIKSIFEFIRDNGEIIAIVLGSIALAIGVVNVAMWAMSANPIVLIIGGIVVAIGALIAIIVLCIKHWDKIWAVVKDVGQSIWDFIKSMAEAIGGFFANLWDGIVAIFSVVVDFFKGIFQGAWDGIKAIWNGVVAFFKAIWDGIVAIFNGVVNFYKTIFTTAWEAIKTVWNVVVSWFKGIWDGIKNVFSTVGTWFTDIFTKAWEGIKKAFSKITGFFQGIWDSIKAIFSKVGKVIGDAITGAVKKAVNTVLSLAVKIINGFISTINLAIGIINAIPGVNIKKLNKLEVPSFDVGTNYVPDDMLAMVHKGERITPAKYNNDDWVGDTTDMTETNDLLSELIDVVNSKHFSISKDEVGKASVNYIISESRRRGEALF